MKTTAFYLLGLMLLTAGCADAPIILDLDEGGSTADATAETPANPADGPVGPAEAVSIIAPSNNIASPGGLLEAKSQVSDLCCAYRSKTGTCVQPIPGCPQ